MKQLYIHKHIVIISSVLLTLCCLSCNKQVSVTPPDVPPPNGFVYIDSYPDGFDIYLNGFQRRRTTPDSLTWLSTGKYLVTLKKNLFRDTSLNVNIVEGEKQSVFVDFSKNPAMLGSIFCNTIPTQAKIFLNGKDISQFTPANIYNLLPGYYWVHFNAVGRRDDSILVAVKSDSVSNISLTLVDTAVWKDYTTRNSGLPTDNLTCINVDRNNIVWAGSSDRGLIFFDGLNWKYFNSTNSQLTVSIINCMNIDRTGNLWLGTPSGPLIFWGGAVAWIGGPNDLPDFNIQAINFDNDNNTWIGMMSGGLLKTFVEGKRIWVYYNKQSGQLPENQITGIACSNDNQIWIGTPHSGVVRKIASDWSYFTQMNSRLPSNNISAMTMAHDNVLWVGCTGGSLHGGSVAYYGDSQFHPIYFSPACNQIYSVYADSRGRIWVGTNKGIYIVENNTQKAYLDKETTGLNLDNASGFAEDNSGNIWIAFNGGGLIEYKNSGNSSF